MSKRHTVSYTQRQIDAPFWWGLLVVLALLLLSSCKASQQSVASSVSSAQLAVDRTSSVAWRIADTVFTYSLANPALAYSAPVDSSPNLRAAAAGSALIPSQVIIRHANANVSSVDTLASLAVVSSEAVESSSRQRMPLVGSHVQNFTLALLIMLVVVSLAVVVVRAFR